MEAVIVKQVYVLASNPSMGNPVMSRDVPIIAQEKVNVKSIQEYVSVMKALCLLTVLAENAKMIVLEMGNA